MACKLCEKSNSLSWEACHFCRFLFLSYYILWSIYNWCFDDSRSFLIVTIATDFVFHQSTRRFVQFGVCWFCFAADTTGDQNRWLVGVCLLVNRLKTMAHVIRCLQMRTGVIILKFVVKVWSDEPLLSVRLLNQANGSVSKYWQFW